MLILMLMMILIVTVHVVVDIVVDSFNFESKSSSTLNLMNSDRLIEYHLDLHNQKDGVAVAV